MSRKLDVAIVEALGDAVKKQVDDYWQFKGNYLYRRVPKYSTDGNAMLELGKEMRERGWVIKYHYFDWKDLHTVIYMKEKNGITQEAKVYQSDTEPLARALAAYKALTGKEWKDTE